jgi:hypothetical protein
MRTCSVFAALLVGTFLLIHATPQALAGQAKPAKAGAAQAVAVPGVVKASPGMPASALANRPDTDLLELPDGRRVNLGDVRRLTAAAKRMRAAAPGSRLPKAFRTKPAATGTPLATSADLAAALKRPDGDTVVLPSGRRVTVGMIRQFQPEFEKRLGRSVSVGGKPADLSGPAVKVDAKTDWKSILDKPDGTVLEAPNGARVAVRDLRKALAASEPARRPPPAKR